MILYFISGLGADERAFQKLSLPTTWKIIHLKWIEIDPKETLESYVLKFSKLIDVTKDFHLVGLSFGGIMAVELSKIIKPKSIIVLSSITTKHELPKIYRLIAGLRINNFVPSYFLNKVYPFTYWYFGMKSKEENQLLKQIIHDTPPTFLKWAINEIVHWKNEIRPINIIHIHGNKDRIFPINTIQADIVVKQGGHFMVYKEADELSALLIFNLKD